MNETTRMRIESATVRFQRRGGLGVLVPGQMIVTAAHVVRRHWRSKVNGVEGQGVVTVAAGKWKAPVEVYAVDLVSDVAVLGEVDGYASEALYKASEAFDEFCESTEPVPLCTTDFERLKPFSVHILTHDKGWVTGHTEQRWNAGCYLLIRAEAPIAGGTSGGPVVTDEGLLLGVASHAAGPVDGPLLEVGMPQVHLVVPGFLLRKMLDPEGELRAIRESIEADRSSQKESQ